MTTTCPYCRAPFEPGEEVVTCEACSTPHHADCYAENAGCTVFGCAKAPVDEPAVSVSQADLSTPVARRSAAPAAPTPPPPPRAGFTTSVAPPPRIAGEELPVVNLGTPSAPPAQGLSFGGYNATQSQASPPPYIPRRNRMTYILLGVLLGAFGGHNFYAGYTKRAVAQLLITLFTCFYGGIISWIWAIVEVCTVKQDDDGIAFV